MFSSGLLYFKYPFLKIIIIAWYNKVIKLSWLVNGKMYLMQNIFVILNHPESEYMKNAVLHANFILVNTVG